LPGGPIAHNVLRMRDIDQVIAALRRRHSDLRAEQRSGDHVAVEEGIWFIGLPSNSIEVQLESPTGNCPFLIESSLDPERLHAATIGEAINMVSTMLRHDNAA
jgi:hypothetical protein